MKNYPEAVLPGTINFHINWQCNADCVFCYRPSGNELSDIDRRAIIRQIAHLPRANSTFTQRRINFAGGEPTLVKTLPDILNYTKSLDLSTSLITNASVYLNKPKKLDEIVENIDMIGVSVDSINETTNKKIKRPHHPAKSWLNFSETVNRHGTYLKVNSTVCSFNADENLESFYNQMALDRLKFLRAISVDGTIGTTKYNANNWLASDKQFDNFVSRHAHVKPSPIIENTDTLRGSYAMISPDGCFYDSTKGFYTRSEPILKVGIVEAFRQVSFSQNKFEKRGGQFGIPVIAV